MPVLPVLSGGDVLGSFCTFSIVKYTLLPQLLEFLQFIRKTHVLYYEVRVQSVSQSKTPEIFASSSITTRSRPFVFA
jgi:hypothetical protein